MEFYRELTALTGESSMPLCLCDPVWPCDRDSPVCGPLQQWRSLTDVPPRSRPRDPARPRVLDPGDIIRTVGVAPTRENVLIRAGLDESDAALDALERAREARDVHLVFLVDPQWNGYRDHPRPQQPARD